MLRQILYLWLVRKLKIDGVKSESELPPEFIISNHAIKRASQRFLLSEEELKEKMLNAWYGGEYMPKEFYIDKHELGYYSKWRNLQYKRFEGIIFIFRLLHNKQLGFSQKNLITVYPDQEYGEKRARKWTF